MEKEIFVIAPPNSAKQNARYLVVGGTSLGELEDDATASEAAVDLGVGVEAVVNTTTLLLVEDDLEGLGVVLLGAEALADNLDGVDEVGKDGVVDGSQSARTGALLLLGVARAVGALGAGENAARGQDEDVAVGELLLELTGEALLDTVETLQGRDGDKDDNRLLAVANFDLMRDQKSACELLDGISKEIANPWTASRPIPRRLVCM